MRARLARRTFGVAILLLAVSIPVSGIGPAAILIRGERLPAPIVVRPEIGSLVFMWGGGTPFYDRETSDPPAGLEGRRYLDYHVFWGQFEPDELKPEAASQHGRLYLPTATHPAAVVLTAPDMASPDPDATRAAPHPIPRRLDDFVFGRVLAASETAALVRAGVSMN